MIVRIAITGIALGIMVMLLSIGIIKGFKEGIKNKLISFSGDYQISSFDNSSSTNAYIYKNPDLEKFIKSDPQNIQYHEVANKISILQHKNRIEPLQIKGLSNVNNYRFLVQSIIKGRRINEQNEILISQYIAQKHSIDTGARLLFYFTDRQVKLRKLKVVGIYETTVEEIDKSIVIADIQLLRSVNDWSNNQLAYYQVYLNEHDEFARNEMLARIDNFLPLDQKIESNEEIYPDIYEWINLLDVNAEVIIILMLIVSGINMLSAILVLILERVSFIGVLKTMGSSNTQIRRIFYYNAAYLMFWGLLIGNVTAVILSYLQNRFKIIELDPNSYYIKYVSIDWTVKDFILLNLGSILCTFVFVWIASFLINRIKPLKAIRFN